MSEIDLLEGEVFCDVPKYRGYISASNFGRIYSHPRQVRKFSTLVGRVVTQKYEGKLLKQYDRSGYQTVRFGIEGKKFTELVSRLVLMAFVREPESGEFACHNDSNPKNNKKDNLRWDFQKGNMKDRANLGKYPCGELHHASKIPVELVDRLQSGVISPAQAARETGFRYEHLWRIAKRLSWKHRAQVVANSKLHLIKKCGENS